MVFGIPWNWPEVFAYCNVIKGNLGEKILHAK